MSSRFLVAVSIAALAAGGLPAWAADAPVLATAPVQSAPGTVSGGYDGVVEAVRQSVVAAQVSGAVTAIEVKVGDSVKAGQLLVRIDARVADQSAAASEAQLLSAQALLDVARKDYDRQRQLYQQKFISQAAVDQAESQFKASQAQAAALRAEANATRSQSGLAIVRAPYSGIVAEVPIQLGDMALPGRALLTLYEPGALRATANVPQSAVPAQLQGAKVELPGLPEDRRWIVPTQVQLLPTVDAGTHTVELRLTLPPGAAGLSPGMFARVWLPDTRTETTAGRLYVPASAVARRGEMTGVYVVDAKGAARLRQVRLGRVEGANVEVLTGVSAGERVALDPQAAAKQR
jgi:membrane fusion protein, multidrug efflux system